MSQHNGPEKSPDLNLDDKADMNVDLKAGLAAKEKAVEDETKKKLDDAKVIEKKVD